MSNTPNVSRDSAKQAPVKRLSSSGMPKAQTKKIRTAGRDPRKAR